MVAWYHIAVNNVGEMNEVNRHRAQLVHGWVTLNTYFLTYVLIYVVYIETARQSDWDGIVACHRGEVAVTTWNLNRSTMGAHRLQHSRFTDDARMHIRTSALVSSLVSLLGSKVLGTFLKSISGSKQRTAYTCNCSF